MKSNMEDGNREILPAWLVRQYCMGGGIYGLPRQDRYSESDNAGGVPNPAQCKQTGVYGPVIFK